MKIKSFLLLSLLVCSFSVNVGAKKKMDVFKLQEMTRPINDSIVNEGYKLYRYEKATWIGTDMVMEHCKYKDDLEGVIVYEATDGKLHCIAYDKFHLQCLLDYTFEENNTYSDVKRPLTEHEAKLVDMRLKMKAKCLETNMINVMECMNIGLIPLPNKCYRMYWLTGTSKSNVVPMGNDYSFDFDENLNIIKKTKYHNSFIPTEWPEGKSVKTVMHSHLDDNPYMTPTDVCNFLLYALDCYEINDFQVISPALDCIHFFNGKTKQILSVAIDTIRKINKHSEKNKKE